MVGCRHIHPAYPSTHLQQPPLGLTFSTRTLKIEMCSSPPGQKTSLTQETELLESLLQEVEHQVGHLKLEMDSWQDTALFLLTVSADASCNTSTQKLNYSALHLKMLTAFQAVKEMYLLACSLHPGQCCQFFVPFLFHISNSFTPAARVN